MRRIDGQPRKRGGGYPKGMGKIKCELCGFPLRDHKIDTHKITKMQAGA